MRVFLSWSGRASHEAAEVLAEFLKVVLPGVETFLSSADLAKGGDWFRNLGEVLRETSYTVVCLTGENLQAPWLLYEAGAAAGKGLEAALVAPLLIGVDLKSLPGPLPHFNAVRAERTEVRKLLATLNRLLGDKAVPEKTLAALFKARWPALGRAFKQAEELALRRDAEFDFEVFLSAPMAAYGTDAEYVPARAEVEKVFTALTEGCGLRVFWAAEKIRCIADFDAFPNAVGDDLRAIERSRAFVLLYPAKMPTSALFEAGYAVASKRPCYFFVPEHETLPYLLQGIDAAGFGVRTYPQHGLGGWGSYTALAQRLRAGVRKWLPAAVAEGGAAPGKGKPRRVAAVRA